LLTFVCLLLGGMAVAQRPDSQSESDLLDKAKRLERVAAQKVEFDIRQALIQVERLARTNPVRAVDRLKQTLAQIENDSVLTPQRRESIKHMLEDRMRVVRSEMDGANAKDKQLARVKDRLAEEASRTAEQRTTAQSVKNVNQLLEAGKTE